MKRKAETPLARKIVQQPRIATAAEPQASEDIELEISMSEGVRGARQACASTSCHAGCLWRSFGALCRSQAEPAVTPV